MHQVPIEFSDLLVFHNHYKHKRPGAPPVLVVVLALLTHATSSASVCENPTGEPQCLVFSGGPPSTHESSASIDPLGGNLHLRQTDFAIANSTLHLTRFYNSHSRTNPAGLGTGWQTNLQSRIVSRTRDSIHLIDPTGRSIVLKRDENGQYRSRNWRDGYAAISGPYTKWHANLHETLKFKGPLLINIEYSDQTTLSLHYKNLTLSSAIHSSGYHFDLEYEQSSSGHPHSLTSVTLTKNGQTPFQSVRYFYKDKLLGSVQPSHQGAVHFTYKQLSTTNIGSHSEQSKINGIDFQAGNTKLRFKADAQGNYIEQRNPLSGEFLTFQYNDSSQPLPTQSNDTQPQTLTPPVRTTEITASTGQKSTIEWEQLFDQALIRSVKTTKCNHCPERTIKFKYDAAHTLSEIVSNDRKIRWNLDANGLPEKYLIEKDGFPTDRIESIVRNSYGILSSFTSSWSDQVLIEPRANGYRYSSKFNQVKIPEQTTAGKETNAHQVSPKAARAMNFAKTAQLLRQVDHLLTARVASPCSVLPPEDPSSVSDNPVNGPCDVEAEATDSANNDNRTSVPGAVFINATTAHCGSYFEVFQGIYRGSAIENGIASFAPYNTSQSTVRWFPVVDFIDGSTAISQISHDLRSASYNTEDGLYDRLLLEGQKMFEDFLQPLAINGMVTATDGEQSTTIYEGDIDTLVFELIVQQGSATPDQIQQIQNAAETLYNQFGIELRVIEIP